MTLPLPHSRALRKVSEGPCLSRNNLRLLELVALALKKAGTRRPQDHNHPKRPDEAVFHHRHFGANLGAKRIGVEPAFHTGYHARPMPSPIERGR